MARRPSWNLAASSGWRTSSQSRFRHWSEARSLDLESPIRFNTFACLTEPIIADDSDIRCRISDGTGVSFATPPVARIGDPQGDDPNRRSDRRRRARPGPDNRTAQADHGFQDATVDGPGHAVLRQGMAEATHPGTDGGGLCEC